MEINKIVEEANEIALKYNLKLVEIDRTDNVISLKLVVDNELFMQIYGNADKGKLNLVLVFKQRRLYGYDSEGDKYHCHPFDNSEGHIYVNDKKSIQEFVEESIKFLEENDLM